MIGDGWDDNPSIRPGPPDGASAPRRVAVVTGSRAEFGLLTPVMEAIDRHPELELRVIAAGSHLVSPALTFRDVKACFPIADSVPMQVAGRVGRFEDAEAVGRGVARFARAFAAIAPAWVVVLGDRIEAFAAAAAAAVGGWTLAHVHGGDRAEGVADESMRHAITKLAHLHLPASAASAERIVRMGEAPGFVRVVGSPAIDGLAEIPPMDDLAYAEVGSPETIVLLHPVGRSDEMEEAVAVEVLAAVGREGTLAFMPNLDPGRAGIVRAVAASGVRTIEHLPRAAFVGLLKRVARAGGVLVGNSSLALIEAAALRLRAVDVGPRQSGRERPGSVVHAERESREAVAGAIRAARSLDLSGLTHPFGDGRAGERVASSLAGIDPRNPGLTRKRCAY
ncbi:MAG: UDP-N-acetylglucosamine 2-epimerase (hydrolyzing) [Phycisphaeraceae bacterium]|nr:MAG: UDP-N-acetylglucosamine 2-epimerase (hydrolyzing) [Phycisphaeraceae bacterium]